MLATVEEDAEEEWRGEALAMPFEAGPSELEEDEGERMVA
jgi:hypothetical protein